MKFFILLLFLFFLPAQFFAKPLQADYFLNGRIPTDNGRYETFHEALSLMDERNVQTIVETGTERWQIEKYSFDGDGGSTIIFGHWATINHAQMYSVDINKTHVEYALNNTKEYESNLKIVLNDSVAFLKNFPHQIDFLYLDSYDYDEQNPVPSQEHCLREIQAAYDKLTTNSIVMIDDCNIPGGGKGYLAIKYLLSKGWYLHRNRHQVILLRNDSITLDRNELKCQFLNDSLFVDIQEPFVP